MARLAALYRHPVKSLGEESVEAATLTVGQPIPWDRVWAVAHDRSAFNPAEPEWVKSRNFVVQTMTPKLAQITCAYDEAAGVLTLSHPDLGEVAADPDEDPAALGDWIAPIAGPSGPAPYRIARREGGAFHDFPDTHLSIGNLASLHALEEVAGRPLAHIRFRMNLWLDGLAPWEELDWADEPAELSVGAARLKIMARVKRCAATHASPETGQRDVEVTKLIHELRGHMDFGVYAQVSAGGRIACGDPVEAAPARA